LQQQNLRLNSGNFMQGFAFSNQASGGDSRQQSFVPTPGVADSSTGSLPPEAAIDDSADTLSAPAYGGRSLSILA